MALFNRSGGGEIEPIESLLTTFGPGTYPIGQNRYGLQGIVPGIYRVETAPYFEGDRDLTNYIGWSLHNSPNPAFDRVLQGGNQTPFLLPVADAKFLTVKSKGGLWVLAEAY
jgi:hypothetical protein